MNSTIMQIILKPSMRGQREKNCFWQKRFNKAPGEYIAPEKCFAFDVGKDNNNFLLVSSKMLKKLNGT